MDFGQLRQQAQQSQQVDPINNWILEYKNNKQIRQQIKLSDYISIKLEIESLILQQKEYELKVIKYQERTPLKDGK